MRALVLSAGYGERLRPLTERIPKPLLEIGGRPLIHYPLMMLRHAGIREIAINVHHLAGRIESAIGRGDSLGVRVTYSPEPTLLGTGGPLLGLRDFFGDEPFVMLNCDTIMGLDLPRMIRLHREHGAIATFALRAGSDAYSRIEIDRDGRIRRMRLLRGRAPGEFDDFPVMLPAPVEAELRPYMYCGAMVCEPSAIEFAPTTPPFSLMGGLFAPIVARGLPLFGYVDAGFFRTIDDLRGYEAVRAEFASMPPPLEYLTR